jgi:hypothetical protein
MYGSMVKNKNLQEKSSECKIHEGLNETDKSKNKRNFS